MTYDATDVTIGQLQACIDLFDAAEALLAFADVHNYLCAQHGHPVLAESLLDLEALRQAHAAVRAAWGW